MAKSISVSDAYKQFDANLGGLENLGGPFSRTEEPAPKSPASAKNATIGESASSPAEGAVQAGEAAGGEPGRRLCARGTTLHFYEDQVARMEIIRRSMRGKTKVGIIRDALDEYLDNHGWTALLPEETLAEYAEYLRKIEALAGRHGE